MWSYAQLRALSLAPTSGNDLIHGGNETDSISGAAGNDTLDGRGGNDVLTGGGGNDLLEGGDDNDTYVFNLGDGQDIIQDASEYDGGSGGTDTLQFGAGILPGDVTVSAASSGNDLVFSIAGGDSITVRRTVVNGYWTIEQATFANGTVWNLADMMSRALAGTSGNDTLLGSYIGDTITGGAGNDTLDGRGSNDVLTGGTGNDLVEGGDGNDTYVFNLGDGQDIIQDASEYDGGSGGTDTLQFGAGILPGDVTVSGASNGNDLVFSVAGGDSITVRRTIVSGSWTIEQATFANGTVWNLADMMSRALAGTSGDDTLLGSYIDDTITGGAGADVLDGRWGNDVLTGGTGNDLLEGGGGNDTYMFNLGDGQDTIRDPSEHDGDYGGTDTLQFGAGITPADIVVSQPSSNDLLLSTIGTSDQIRLVGVVNDGNWRIEQIKFADNTTWTHSDLVARISPVSSGDDIVVGTSNADLVHGLAGNDAIQGRAGNDSLYGEQDNDTLIGGAGADALHGGSGNDVLDGDGIEATGSNLLTNGSFETAGPGASVNWWGTTADTIPGWTKTNGSQYELHVSGHDGVYASDGGFWLETDGGWTDTNMNISQSVSGLSAGAVYELDFDAANLFSGTTGAFEVRWNGTLIATINQQTSVMKPYNFLLTAQSGSNTIQFTGIGAAEGSGSSLDNVRLFATQPITGGNDVLSGDDGDDRLTGGGGNDTLDGGNGSDTAVYAGDQADYTITTSGGGIQIVDDETTIDGDDGTDSLINVETAVFSDGSVNLAAPIILDLNGDGVKLVSKTKSKVSFDWDDSGIGNRTGWVDKKDGLLVFDRNGDGKVSGANELSFLDDKPGAKSDLDGLSAFDSNADGVFSAADAQYDGFRVWRDKNGNGQSDKGELMTLSQAGVASINLAGTATERDWGWNDNLVINTGSFTRTNGRMGALGDVALNYADDPVQSGRFASAAFASRFVEAIAAFASKGSDEVTIGKHDMEMKKELVFGGDYRAHF